MLRKTFLWSAQGVTAAIFLQTLFFKLTYAPETRFIFQDLGGRPAATLTGLLELVAAIMLLTPRYAAIGAALSLGVISGALGTHLFKLGIVVNDDGGALFGMAVVVALLSASVLFLRRRELPVIGQRFNALAATPA